MLPYIYNWLASQGVALDTAVVYARWLTVGATLLLSVLAYLFTRYVVVPAAAFSVRRSNNLLDNSLQNRKIASRISLLAPAVVVYLLIPVFLDSYAPFIDIGQSVVLVFIIVMGVLVIKAFLDGLQVYFLRADETGSMPIKGFMQVLDLIVFFVGGLLILAILLDRTPLYLLSGLGALTAVLTIVFRDPLLGLLAGVQLTANNLVSRGDWIDMPKYDASGEVLEVALTTVQIRNADQSITTVPTYSLISESFKNWRGIDETNARRIKRAVYVDLNTVRFCTAEMLARYERLPYVGEYLAQQRSSTGNGNGRGAAEERRFTNVGIFRAYATAYLQNHPDLYADRTLLVRQLDSGPNGLPIEVYVYSRITDFAAFETLQADVIDHLLATLPAFDLRVFQSPAGSDVQRLATTADSLTS